MTSESEFSWNQAIDFQPLTTEASASVKDVITLLNQSKVSYVLIVEQGNLLGIFTERDVVCLTAKSQEFTGFTIADVMSKNLISITTSQITDIFMILDLMRRHRIRHLPVLIVLPLV